MDFNAFFQLSYGLYIVTSKHGDKVNGFIGNSVFQVTATPPTIAISVNKENFTHGYIEDSHVFSISVLAKQVNPDIIQTFGYKSGKDYNKFSNISWEYGENGVPIVTIDAGAVFECRVISSLDVGTHTIFVGEVISANVLNSSSDPLTYSHYRNVFKGKAPEKAPTYINETKLQTEDSSPPKDIWICQVCYYEYDPAQGDPEHGISPGTPFSELPDDWTCPVCGVGKDEFKLAK